MALKRLDGLEKIDLIHHSDRGVQYASSEYVHLLQKNHIKISMTETGDPKENAQAERINNTMKNELLKGKRFTDIDQVRAAVAQAVDFYNLRRPHMSINMMTLAEAAFCEGVLEKWWISYREKAVQAILRGMLWKVTGKQYLCLPFGGLLPAYGLQSTQERDKDRISQQKTAILTTSQHKSAIS